MTDPYNKKVNYHNNPANDNLSRSDTFQGWDVHNEQRMTTDPDDSIMDEETWDWPVLLTRVFCLFLVFIILVLLSLGEIDYRLMVLAAIVFVLLLLIIIGTFVDITWMLPRCVPTWCLKSKPRNQLTTPLINSDAHGDLNFG
jgi:hypothetical protein